ncbi:MAG: hypothetical protein ACOCR6_03590 [archaeon]
MVEYLYRSNQDEQFVEEIERGSIRGADHRVWRGSLGMMPSDSPVGDEIESIDWDRLLPSSQPVTGGVSGSLAQTRRFSGSKKYAMVLSRYDTVFTEVEYNYDWFNEHEGVYDHIRSMSDGEIRLTGPGRRFGGDLYGTVKREAQLDGSRVTKIRHWGGEDELSGMAGSRFEDESEWVAMQDEVVIGSAIEGVVSVVEEQSIRVAYTRGKDMIPKDAPPYDEILPQAYEYYREPLPPWTTFYLLVVDDFQHYKLTEYGGWREEDVLAAYRDDGELEPSQVPPKFRGENV